MELALSSFNIIISVFGGWVTIFGLFSHLLKEKFYLSEALLSLIAGALFTHVFKILKPQEYAGSQENLNSVTLDFSRLVLGIQLVLAGVQLPSRYLKKEWRCLLTLLGPGMAGMWACSSLAMWAIVPDLPLLHAMAIAACITPTDPVLSNSIVKGRYADENVPQELQQMIIAESGANDGLGYPFLFFALYLIKYASVGTEADQNIELVQGILKAMRMFIGETCGYVVLFSILYGWTVGYAAKTTLQWAKRNKYVDRESFLVFAIPLALFIVGTCGILNSDDVLACFVAGNAFTWDDWFRLKTLDDSLQPTADMLLNMAIFMWLGAVCPWDIFWSNDIMSFSRLLVLGVIILLTRRLPIMLGIYRYIHQVSTWREALFVGYFGPIGVSAAFYLYVGTEFLQTITNNSEQTADVQHLQESMTVVVWFLIISSVAVHGLTIPIANLRSFFFKPLPGAIVLPT